ncbi:hypothetical protein Tco_1364422, partial [Tanacetum coccineum]
YRYDGLPIMPEDPYVEAALQATPSPDYVSSPEEPEQAPPSPVYVPYVPEPVYPEFMPLEDKMLPAEEGDDDDDESYNDDEDDDDVEEDEDEEEEEEHLASGDSVLPPVHCVTVRMSVRAHTPLPSDTEVARLLAIPTPPPSPLSPLSSPLPPILSPLPQILSPPLPVSPPPLPANPTYPLRYRAAMIRLRAESRSTSHLLPLPPSGTPPILHIPLLNSSPPLLLPPTDHRVGVP